ncbi:UNVERIFIED_CONTAM: hypothetical protein FKN15_015748 [Acipenser sinensis]
MLAHALPVAVLCCAPLCCAVLFSTVLYYTVLCCAVLYYTVLCCAVLCSTVLCCACRHCLVLQCALLCCAVLHCAVLCLGSSSHGSVFLQKVSAATVRLLILENILLSPPQDLYLLVGAHAYYRNIKIVPEIPVEYLDRLLSTENGSCFHVRTLQPGATAVRATLVSVTAQNGTVLSLSPPISHLQEVHIYSPIVMKPKVLAFPWQPNNGVYRHQIQVEGGSGNFTWSSSNLSVSTVTVKGAVLAGLELGTGVIRARDSQNPTHHGETTPLVLEALVTPGSDRVLLFEGGPRPWILVPSRFYTELRPDSEQEGVRIVQLGQPEVQKNQHGYRVTCTSLGEEWLTFRIGNLPGVLNPHPAAEAVQVKLVCALPASLALSPLLQEPVPSQPCPILQHHRQTVYPLKPGSSLLYVYDLCLKSSEPAGVSLHVSDISDFELEFIHNMEVNQPAPLSLNLLLDRLFTVPPQENLTLTQGSGHFLVRVVDSEVVEVTMLEAKNIVQVSPLKPGSSLLYVYDLCLKSSEPAGVSLHVSDISDFELEFIHNMEVNQPAPLNVRVLDSSRLPFHSRYFGLMELRVHTASSIVTVEKIADRDEVTASYVLQAVSLGETKDEIEVEVRELRAVRIHAPVTRLRTGTEVTVRAADSVALTPPADRYLTNSPGSPEYRVTVTIGATASHLKGPCSPVQLSAVHSALRPELDLSCSLQFSGPCVESVLQQAFRVSPHYSTSTVPNLPPPLNNHSAQSPSSSQSPQCPLSSSLPHSQVWSDCPDIRVGDPVQSLQVPGLLLFSVFPSSASVLQQGADSTARLHLTSAVTGQHVTIGVTVRGDEHTESGPGWDQCQDSGLFWQLTDSSHLLLFTMFAVLAGTAAVFIGMKHRAQCAKHSPLPGPGAARPGPARTFR